jgi:protein-tyrosine-phosphatase
MWQSFKKSIVFKGVAIFLAMLLVMPGHLGFAQTQNNNIVGARSPRPGRGNPAPTANLLTTSANYSCPSLKGLRFNPNNPLKLEFIIDTANQGKVTKEESAKLIKYFLAGLTLPEDDLWVNLSPYEKERIVPQSLGETDLGKEMLEQDYLLKQLAASLTYPETEQGKAYWNEINGVGARSPRPGRGNPAPTNTFNKIWITPDVAGIYENGNTGFITEATLKVMMEEDYVAMQVNGDASLARGFIGKRSVPISGTDPFKTHILPLIESDVNSGKNFASLRQIYNSLILAVWFKQKFKESFYKNYIDTRKIKGIDLADKNIKEKIWQQYVAAFKTGVYDYVKPERGDASLARGFTGKRSVPICGNKITHRRYFSGGATFVALKPKIGFDRRGFLGALLLGGGGGYVAARVAGKVNFNLIGTAQAATSDSQLHYPDGTVMLGENEPGICYNALGSYRMLLDESEGGRGEARDIVRKGFKVIKVYMSSMQQMAELAQVSEKIYKQYGIKTTVIFSSRFLGLVNDHIALDKALDEFVAKLAKYPWIIVQVGNEENFYIKNGFFVGEGQPMPFNKQQYYSYYGEVIKALKVKLRAVTPPSQKIKPILFSYGVNIDSEAMADEMVDDMEYIRSMNPDALAVNLYVSPVQAYGLVFRYLYKELPYIPLVAGEFGRSSHNALPGQQRLTNRGVWDELRKSGVSAGGFLFSYHEKNANDASARYYDKNLGRVVDDPYDKKYGIRSDATVSGRYYDHGGQGVRKPNSNVFDQANFWLAAQEPGENMVYLENFVQARIKEARVQQSRKKQLLEERNKLNDQIRNSFESLNLSGAALQYMGMVYLYQGDWPRLKECVEKLRELSLAQIYYDKERFWSPWENLKIQIKIVSKINSSAELKKIEKTLVQEQDTQRTPAFKTAMAAVVGGGKDKVGEAAGTDHIADLVRVRTQFTKYQLQGWLGIYARVIVKTSLAKEGAHGRSFRRLVQLMSAAFLEKPQLMGEDGFFVDNNPEGKEILRQVISGIGGLDSEALKQLYARALEYLEANPDFDRDSQLRTMLEKPFKFDDQDVRLPVAKGTGKFKVALVCAANFTRSPAMYLAVRQLLAQAKLDNIELDTFGVLGGIHLKPNPALVEAAAHYFGITREEASIIPRGLTLERLTDNDMIIVASQEHKDAAIDFVRRLAGPELAVSVASKIKVFAELVGEVPPAEQPEVNAALEKILGRGFDPAKLRERMPDPGDPAFDMSYEDLFKMIDVVFQHSLLPQLKAAAKAKTAPITPGGISPLVRKMFEEHVGEVVDSKQGHVRYVVRDLRAFTNRDFNFLYGHLAPEEKIDRDEYFTVMEGLWQRWNKLSPSGKAILEAAAYFHDIGSVKGKRNWDHNKRGAARVREVFAARGLEPGFTETVARIVEYHGMLSSIGTDYLPGDLDRFSYEEKDILLLLVVMDLSGRGNGINMATPSVIDELLMWRAGFGADAKEFVKYRLGNLLIPVSLLDNRNAKARHEKIYAAFSRAGILSESFIDNWSRLIRVNSFTVFGRPEILPDNGIDYFVALTNRISAIVDQWKKNKDVKEVIVDTDIDLMPLSIAEKIDYYKRFISLWRHGKDIPISAGYKEGVLSLTLEVSKLPSDGSGVSGAGSIDGGVNLTAKILRLTTVRSGQDFHIKTNAVDRGRDAINRVSTTNSNLANYDYLTFDVTDLKNITVSEAEEFVGITP